MDWFPASIFLLSIHWSSGNGESFELDHLQSHSRGWNIYGNSVHMAPYFDSSGLRHWCSYCWEHWARGRGPWASRFGGLCSLFILLRLRSTLLRLDPLCSFLLPLRRPMESETTQENKYLQVSSKSNSFISKILIS